LALMSFVVPVSFSIDASAKAPFCQREYARLSKIAVLHRAVATTNGKSLGAPNIACGFSGQDTKQQAIRGALKNCEKSAKRNGNSSKCQIIEAK
jgi:hypothetical protein